MTDRPASPPVVAFEGLDGTGKSTQCRLLVDRLAAAGREATLLPLFRSDIVEEMLDDLDRVIEVPDLGSRYAVVAKVLARQAWLVEPLLAGGSPVVYDKFLLTFFANESVRGASRRELVEMVARVRPPDLTFVLRLDPDVALTRKGGRVGFREAGLNLASYQGEPVSYERFAGGGYPEEFLHARYVEFQQSVQAEFERLVAETATGGGGPFGRRVVVLDSARPIDDLAEEIWAEVAALLGSTDPLAARG